MATAKDEEVEGKAVDARGAPAVDPSENVKALSEAANKRQDDLRLAGEDLTKARLECLSEKDVLRSEHTKELAEIRDAHAKEIRTSEAARLDSIRQVDVTAVRTEATRALEAIQTLAATTARDAETLRNALVNTAATIAAQTAETVKQISDRISALERSSYEGVGKQRLADPMMTELLAEVKVLRGHRSETLGSEHGIGTTWGAIGVVAGLLIAAVSVSFSISRPASPPQPVVQYVPAPTASPGIAPAPITVPR